MAAISRTSGLIDPPTIRAETLADTQDRAAGKNGGLYFVLQSLYVRINMRQKNVQCMYAVIDGKIATLRMPGPDEVLIPGVCWGAFDQLFTPAYWKGQAWQHAQIGTYKRFRIGSTFEEEVTACLLGGYGIPAELGLAAFYRLRDRGLIHFATPMDSIIAALTEPFTLHGTSRRYRFAKQKARYLVDALRALKCHELPNDDVALRDYLTTLPGIGNKTASWIVRNFRESDAVAILDVHIIRAGQQLGLFHKHVNLSRDYHMLETEFLRFARAVGVRPALLDAMMWDYMRTVPAALKN